VRSSHSHTVKSEWVALVELDAAGPDTVAKRVWALPFLTALARLNDTIEASGVRTRS